MNAPKVFKVSVTKEGWLPALEGEVDYEEFLEEAYLNINSIEGDLLEGGLLDEKNKNNEDEKKVSINVEIVVTITEL